MAVSATAPPRPVPVIENTVNRRVPAVTFIEKLAMPLIGVPSAIIIGSAVPFV
jgi:hypothetical protein